MLTYCKLSCKEPGTPFKTLDMCYVKKLVNTLTRVTLHVIKNQAFVTAALLHYSFIHSSRINSLDHLLQRYRNPLSSQVYPSCCLESSRQ